jgi:microtubule-associated protein-like 6
MAISPNGKFLAIGTDKGEFMIFDANSLNIKLINKDRKNPISEIKFSPNGEYLAVGSNDCQIFIYEANKNFKILRRMKGHVSRVTHLDFSEDSDICQSNSTSYDLLYHSISTGKQLPGGASAFKDEKWSTWTCPIGWPSQGIWPPCSSGDDINAVDRDKNRTVLVTADDFGKVKLFKYPCAIEKASFKKFIGHSSHVTNIKFSHNDEYVISTGGNDKSIFQWKYYKDQDAEQEENIYKDIQDEDNNPDYEEKVINFKEEEMEMGDQASASKPWLGEVKASTPKNFVINKNSGDPPREEIKLKYVFGYRAFDTRMNVKYTNQEKIIYHTAALGVLLNKENNHQTFFTKHDEDIVALAINKDRNIAATGQMAKSGKAKVIDIYIWDIETKEVLANLKGFHLRAIRNVKLKY